MTRNEKPRTKLVSDYMTRKVFTVRLDKKMIAVKSIMDWAHIRHIPVVNQSGGVVGMLSHRDLLSASLSSMQQETTEFDRRRQLWTIPIKQVMNKPVLAVKPSTAISKVAQVMRSRKIGALPVVENKKLIGIITEHDLLRALEETLNSLSKE